MDNNDVIKSICQLENIDLTNYYPITENGEHSDKDFDKDFSLDRTYESSWRKYKKRVRFVIYHLNINFIYIHVCKLRISNIIKNPNNKDNKIYFKAQSKNLLLKDIERPFKLKKLLNELKNER